MNCSTGNSSTKRTRIRFQKYQLFFHLSCLVLISGRWLIITRIMKVGGGQNRLAMNMHGVAESPPAIRYSLEIASSLTEQPLRSPMNFHDLLKQWQ